MKADNWILVSGATGFLGAYLLRALVREGRQVRALRRQDSDMSLVADIADEVAWVYADVLDVPALEVAFEGVQWVYHCAGYISYSPDDVAQMRAVNEEGTANIVNLCMDFGVRKLLYVSSIAALGRNEDSRLVDESTKWTDSALNTNYAISKFRAECEVWRGVAEGLRAVVINPSVIVGSGKWSDSSCRLFGRVADGLKYYPTGATGWVDVRDVADVMVLLMESDVEQTRFVVNGANCSYKQVFEWMADGLGVDAPRTKVSGWMAALAWRMEWLKGKLTGRKQLITRETAMTSAHIFEYSSAKLLDMFPTFRYRDIQHTIHTTSKQYVASKQMGKKFALLP
jgi:dihydroflavonol-4-reductase